MHYKRIRELRKKKNLSQEALGNAIGVSQRAYAYYETGARLISPKTLSALAKFHGTSMEYLIELTDDPAPPARRSPKDKS